MKMIAKCLAVSALILFVLFANTSPAFAWATAYGRITYNGMGLDGVIVTDHTAKKSAISREENGGGDGERRNKFDRAGSGLSVMSGGTSTGGGGYFSLDGLDCGADPSTKFLTIDGFAGGVPPLGVPPGGIFSPQSIALGAFNNGVNYGPFNVIYTPPNPPTNTPVPTPTPTPIPCDKGTTCPPDMPYCRIGADGKGVCGQYPPPTPKNNANPNSSGLSPTPTRRPLYPTITPPSVIPFMEIQIGS